jgi:hypothetical protein
VIYCMFQNTPTKVDACVSTEEPQTCDASTVTMDPIVTCAAYTQTETRYVMTTNQSMKIASWVFWNVVTCSQCLCFHLVVHTMSRCWVGCHYLLWSSVMFVLYWPKYKTSLFLILRLKKVGRGWPYNHKQRYTVCVCVGIFLKSKCCEGGCLVCRVN